MPLIVEIKARCERPDVVREVLKEQAAAFKGRVRQVDTYLACRSGRLKLRESGEASYLVHYAREDRAAPKDSHVTLYRTERPAELKRALAESLGVLVVVDKQREVYTLENVHFHVDALEGLGTFVEIEARDMAGTIGREALLGQCERYMTLLGIQRDALVSGSYSDMLLGLARGSGEAGGH